MSRFLLPLLTLLVAWIAPLSASASASPAAFQQDQAAPIVEAIRVEGGGEQEAAIRGAITQTIGAELDILAVQRSQEWLWKYMRVRVDQITYEEGEDFESVILVFHVKTVRTWRRVVFNGYEEFERNELELWAGLYGQALDSNSIDIVRNRLMMRYQEEGFAHVQIAREEGASDEIVFQIEEGPKVTVEDVQFEGNEAITGGSWITPGLDLYETLKNTTGGWLSGKAYSPARIEEDVNALVQLYRDYGFLDVAITSSVDFYGSSLSKALIVYNIVEGPLYRIRSVEVRAADGENLRFSQEELLALLMLKEGAPYELATITQDRLALQRHYGGLGYPSLARVHLRNPRSAVEFLSVGGSAGRNPDALVDGAEPLVDLVFVIQEGHPRRLRDVVIKGNVRTQDRVIRREILNEPGSLISEEDASRSLRRLIGLGYFRDENRQPFVNWYLQDFGNSDLVDLVFEVKDVGSNNRLRFGGSWNSDNGPALLIDLTKTNFDLMDTPSSFGNTLAEIWNGSAFTGAGQSLNIALRPGTIYSSYAVSFTEPDLLQEHIDRLSLNVSGRKNLRLFSTHDEERSQLGFTLGRRFGRYFTVFAGPEVQNVNLSDIEAGAPADLTAFSGDNTMNTFTLGARFSTVADPFSPVDGGNYSLTLAQTGQFMGGDWDFLKASMRASQYFPLYQDSLGRHYVFALSGTVRKAWTQGDLTALPYPEKFYLGGQNSVRGFNFRGIGEDPSGFGVGGEVAWNTSVELRMPMISTRQRGMVEEFEMARWGLFLDAGSFGTNFGNLESTRVAAGVAVRVRFPALPTAPLSLEFGWPLQSESGDDTRVFAFTIGNF
jgi:outer membrane protein insertion porin family